MTGAKNYRNINKKNKIKNKSAVRKLENCRYVGEQCVTHPDLMRNFGRNKTPEVETANVNVLTISSNRVSSFPLCYSKTMQYQAFVELC